MTLLIISFYYLFVTKATHGDSFSGSRPLSFSFASNINSKLLREKQRHPSSTSTNSHPQSPEPVTPTDKLDQDIPTKPTHPLSNQDKLNGSQKKFSLQYSNSFGVLTKDRPKDDLPNDDYQPYEPIDDINTYLDEIEIGIVEAEHMAVPFQSDIKKTSNITEKRNQKPMAPVIPSGQVAISAIKRCGGFLTRAISTPSIVNRNKINELNHQRQLNDEGNIELTRKLNIS